MPGFFVGNKKTEMKLVNVYPNLCVCQSLNIPGMSVKRNTLNKFMDDKAFAENDDYVIVSDGYILNKISLFEKYNVDTVELLFVEMYRKNGDEFFGELKGGFSGAFYDKKLDKWLVFTNQVGDAAVYYTISKDAFFAGSQVNYIIDVCREKELELSFDENAAYQMLTHAFMLDDTTYAKEIKRLVGGTYICVEKGIVEIKSYHIFKKNKQRFANSTDDEIVDEVNRAFLAATRLEYDKDLEYGYAHLTDISGGLDSRMTLWAAHSLGYHSMQLITYCKANYLDEIIGKQIAAYWKDEILVKQLDDAQYLYDIDDIVFMNGGLSLYSGISGGNRMLKALNPHIYGLEHTGINGNGSITSYLSSLDDTWSGRYSEKLVYRMSDYYRNYSERFDDRELYLNYTRAYRGMANTFQIRRNYTEVTAPFLDVDFIQLCFDIPIERRANYRLYKKWVLTKHPEAAQFKWESTGAKITENKVFTIIRKIVTRGPQKLLQILGLGHKVKSGMTPIAYWIENDSELKTYLDGYAKEWLDNSAVRLSSQLISDMKELYSTGTATEKTMVLTVLGSVKLYFGNNQ